MTQIKRKKICLAMQSVIGLLILCIFLFPIYWMVVSSLKTSGEIFASVPTLFPKEVYFGNYASLFHNNDFVVYLKNSIIIGFLSMFSALIIATPCAYGLARKKLKGAEILLFAIIIIQMIPSNSMSLPLYAMFSKLKLTGNFIGIVLANITISLPFIILILRTSFLSIPAGLEDAAYIDGCSAWGAFLKIIMPLTAPALLTCATFGFVFAWGEFLYALILLPNKEFWPLTVGMRTFIGQHGTDWGGLMATATISSLPVVVIFALTQKYIVGGITAGSIKG